MSNIDQEKLAALREAVQEGNIKYALEYIQYEVGCGHGLGKLDEVLEFLDWWVDQA